MSRRFSARRYAQALFELGGTEGKLDKWRSDLEKVAMLGTDPEVVIFLEHPRITQATKSKILSKAAGEIDPEILNLVYIMIKRGILTGLPEVLADFQELIELQQGIERGRLAAPVALSPAEIDKVSSLVGEIMDKKIILDSVVDESLLGGMVVRVAGKLLDGSTRTALADLKQKLS